MIPMAINCCHYLDFDYEIEKSKNIKKCILNIVKKEVVTLNEVSDKEYI